MILYLSKTFPFEKAQQPIQTSGFQAVSHQPSVQLVAGDLERMRRIGGWRPIG